MPDTKIGNDTFKGEEIYFSKLDDGNYLIKDEVGSSKKKPFLNKHGITLFADTRTHEGYSAIIYGFMSKTPFISEGFIPNEQMDFSSPIIKDMFNIDGEFKVFVSQSLPLHNWVRIGDYFEGNKGVYGYAPFKSETEYGICRRSIKE